ncbi:MAG: TetR/AcrR family transcriptional regulator [Bacteroidota bacterium]
MTEPKRSKSFRAIAKSAKDLFWKYGISRVTVEEICKEAGVSKMTFYRNFKNKQEVAKQVITDLVNQGNERYDALRKEDIPYAEKMKKMLEIKHESSKGISVEFVNDIYKNEETELQALIHMFQAENISRVMEDFKEAQEKGWIRQDLNLSFVMYMMNEMSNKATDENLKKLYPEMSDLIMEITKFFLYGIMPRDKKDL